MSCASIVRTEVDGVANDLVHEQACVAAARPAVDIGHLPCGMIGGIVRPQFKARASVISGEIDGIANQFNQSITCDAVPCTAIDIRHPPSRMIGGIVRPQFITGASIVG